MKQERAWIPALSLIWSSLRRHPARLAMGLAALLISSGCLLSIPKILGYFIDKDLVHGHLTSLHIAAALLFAVVTVYAVTVALRTYLISWVGESLVADIRGRVFSRLLDLPLGFFETHPTGDLLSRLTSDVTLLETMVSIVIPIGLRSGIQLIGALVLMASINRQLTGAILLIGPLLAGVALIFGRKVRKAANVSREDEARAVMQIEATLNAVATVKSFSAEKHESARFDAFNKSSFSARERLMRARGYFTFIVFFLALNVAVMVVYVGGLKVSDSTMNWGMVTQFLIYVSIAAFSAAGLAEIFGEVKKTIGATERLFHILHEPPESGRMIPPLPVPPGGGAVAFDTVNFAYPARPLELALRDFSLSIPPGEMIALVGPSGAGKTTVLRLLLRLYDPQTGGITLDGANLRDLDPRDLRRHIAVVSQEPVIFSGTARDNICYGNPAATEAQIIEASRLAQAHEFITRLPLGYDTPLGEKGQQLSSGQRQRLAIARALVREPRILILDEATSAMDSENEMLLRKTFTQFLGGRTILIVAHRLATVQAADRVVVLDHGRIQGQGSHFHLLTTCPLYAHLVALEFEQNNGV
jgi:ATP-binding cassette, subfamily B, bacterial